MTNNLFINKDKIFGRNKGIKRSPMASALGSMSHIGALFATQNSNISSDIAKPKTFKEDKSTNIFSSTTKIEKKENSSTRLPSMKSIGIMTNKGNKI